MKYDFSAVEQKWQKKWEDEGVFHAQDNSDKPKFYGLVEFPYPSGAGMHVGHIKAYSGLEVVSRKRRMQGYNVLFPIGFDAYGLPTENYAIKTGIHPRKVTDMNIEKFSSQLKKVGFSFDWTRVVDTTEESYYKWTQWIFLKMFENGLVFRDNALVNYCPSCKVVLSNEDSQGGKCDICHSDIVQKSKDVWYLRITKYADKLLEGLEGVDYLPNVRQQQINWIGKSTGAFVNFSITGMDEKLRIYTTRCDTLYGVTLMVIAPEHPIIEKWADKLENIDEIREYQAAAAKKSDFERTEMAKDKTGVKLEGVAGINPATGKEIPIFVSDYVLMSYGTGAIMAVPGHDTRDWEFAKKFGLPIIEVVKGGNVEEEAFTDCATGIMVNSGMLDGLSVEDAKVKIIDWLKEQGKGEAKVNFKLRDWVFSRQRYWGEPIPMVYCEKCGWVPIDESELPLRLPDCESFEQTDDGQSPLSKMTDWVNTTCPHCGGPAQRETDTMPQWAGSSWYFLRYMDPHNENELASKEAMEYWGQVDWYNGGMEHTTLHLLYSRFWHKFLYDLGLVSNKEPYAKRTSHGMILGENGEKMSKSRGNVVNPDDIIKEYGADTMRLYEMFIGDFEKSAPWSTSSIKGCKRFLDRLWALNDMVVEGSEYSKELETPFHKTIKKVSEDIESMKFNTAIATLMSLLNEIYDHKSINKAELKTLLSLTQPFAPHIAEEMWELNQLGGMANETKWPEYDEAKCIDSTVEIVVQLNGRIKSRIVVPTAASKDELLAAAKADAVVKAEMEGKNIVKEIVVPGKLVNIVVK